MYELYQAQVESVGEAVAVWDREPATVAAVDGLLVHLETLLTRVEFLDPSNPGQVMSRLRRLFTRIRPDETEISILRGALTEIERALGRGDTGPK